MAKKLNLLWNTAEDKSVWIKSWIGHCHISCIQGSNWQDIIEKLHIVKRLATFGKVYC